MPQIITNKDRFLKLTKHIADEYDELLELVIASKNLRQLAESALSLSSFIGYVTEEDEEYRNNTHNLSFFFKSVNSECDKSKRLPHLITCSGKR